MINFFYLLYIDGNPSSLLKPTTFSVVSNRSAVSKDLQTNNKGEYCKEVPVEETKDNKMVIPSNRTSFVTRLFSFSK